MAIEHGSARDREQGLDILRDASFELHGEEQARPIVAAGADNATATRIEMAEAPRSQGRIAASYRPSIP
jgi:hypothetical protein